MNPEEEAEVILGELDASDAMRPETATREQSIEFLEAVIAGASDRLEQIQLELQKSSG